jgi:hypothetical protein
MCYTKTSKSHFLSPHPSVEGIMRAKKSFLIAVICLFLGFIVTISLAQQVPDELLTGEAGAGANLVVTSVSGPATAFLNQKISVTYNVTNQGGAASGAYQVGLYLSRNNTIDPANDRLLKNLTFATGLAPGQSKKTTSTVVIPNYYVNELSGKYYYGAVVATSTSASSKQVSIIRYSLTDDNETVTDHKTDLVWQRTDDGQTRNWEAAYQYCMELVLAGYDDWRFPSVDNLFPLADRSRFNPAIDPLFDCRSGDYWANSESASNPDDSWLVGFQYGNAFGDPKVNNHYVRCVRGEPVTAPSYTVPGPPTGVVATAGNAQATVNFTAPVSDGGSSITSYTVTSSPGGKTTSGASSPITVTGLTNWITYTFTVTATNAIGTGPASSPSNSVTPVDSAYTVPGPPTGVVATAGNAQATVNFTAPALDGGKPITSYTVTSSPGGKMATATSSPITMTGLTNGKTYTFTVKATNAIGTGPASSPSNSVTPATKPGPPTGVVATAGNAQATVNFTAPVSDGGSSITSYTVTSSPGGIIATGPASPVTVTGLTNWATYTFCVKATNSVGTGSGSCSNSVTPTDPATAFSVSGRVATSEGTGISGVIMTFRLISGSVWLPGAVTTDSNGNWSQSGFASGPTYRVTPSKYSNDFLPGSMDFMAAQSDLDFVITLRYFNNGNGTVTDNNTGVIWQKAGDGVQRNWTDATQYCANLALGGYGDWRLPPKDELLTIVIHGNNPTIDPVFDCRSAKYWTSTASVVNPGKAWFVNFGDSHEGADSKTYERHVRCVRGGP